MTSDFWAGYISGALGIIIGNPLDVVKVRLQAGNSPDASPRPHLSRFERASSLVRGLCAAPITFELYNIDRISRRGCPDFGIRSSQCDSLRGIQSVIDITRRLYHGPHQTGWCRSV